MPAFRFHHTAFGGILIVLTSCRSPQADALIAQQMREMGDELNNARQEQALMHDQLDSLRRVVVSQDTLLRQLAGMAGVPVKPR